MNEEEKKIYEYLLDLDALCAKNKVEITHIKTLTVLASLTGRILSKVIHNKEGWIIQHCTDIKNFAFNYSQIKEIDE